MTLTELGDTFPSPSLSLPPTHLLFCLFVLRGKGMRRERSEETQQISKVFNQQVAVFRTPCAYTHTHGNSCDFSVNHTVGTKDSKFIISASIAKAKKKKNSVI